MKKKGLRYCAWLLFGMQMILSAQAQETSNSTAYQLETFGSVSVGGNTPFWMMSNRYGTVPLNAGNGYFRGKINHNQTFGKGFYWGAGIDAIVAAPRYRNIYIQQLFAEIGYQAIVLTVGSKEQYRSDYDRRLSSGDLVQSANARPYPKISLSVPSFAVIPYTKGWFQMKGDLIVGQSLDEAYLSNTLSPSYMYINDVMWHHKSLFARIQDTRGEKPLSFSFGVQHYASWGGTSTDPKLGEQPKSFKDLIRVFLGRSGGEDASIIDQANVLGNHAITYEFKLGYTKRNWSAHAYYQHLSFDKSGLTFYNGTDGLWGLQVEQNYLPWVKKILVEYVNTRNQSGAFHFIDFDHVAHPGRGGGGDDYYNNELYTTGNSYFGQAIGNPLLTSPIYNKDGKPGFRNTRIKDWHLGLEGDIISGLSYRLLLTYMQGWGTPYQPYLEKKSGVSCLVDLIYRHPDLKNWEFTGTGAFDTGNVFGKRTVGISIGVRKTGIIKDWK